MTASRPGPTRTQKTADRVAAMLVVDEEEPDADTTPDVSSSDTVPKKKRGRPPGKKREVVASMTVHFDAHRHAELERIASRRCTSIHSLLMEGADKVIKDDKNI